MKNFLFFFLLATGFSASATNFNEQCPNLATITSANPAFNFLRGHTQGRNAYSLQWSMTSTAGIDHYEIQSTYEDPYDFYANWTNLGNVTGSRSNIIKFTDYGVMPGFISYRVIAVFNNGQPAIVSEIYSATIY